MRKALPETREKFIDAALDELYNYGISGFSIRHVAQTCGVSCAAPYRHFESKNQLIGAVIDAVVERWRTRAIALLKDHKGTFREQILDISIEYIRFLCENRGHFTVAVMNEQFLSEDQRKRKSLISRESKSVIDRYCIASGMDAETKKRKTFIVRAVIMGAAEMITSGSLEYTEANLQMIRSCIDREFDLP